MKKKLLLIIPIIFTFILCIDVKAAIVMPDDVPDRTYIIGTHMLTREPEDGAPYEGSLTTRWIMYSSQTIHSALIDDMIIYYKNPNGEWKDGLDNSAVELPEDGFYIEFIDGVEQNNISVPTLAQDTNGPDGDHQVPEFFVEEGKVCANVRVNSADLIYEVEGYTLYNSDDTVVSTPDTLDAPVKLCEANGTTKSYYAKAFILDENDEKAYSDKSNVLQVNFTIDVPTPTFTQDMNGPDGDHQYPEYIVNNAGKLCANVRVNAEPLTGTVDGYTVFTAIDNAPYETPESLNSPVVFCDIDGTDMTLYAKSYIVGTDDSKLYSGKSNTVTLDFSNLHLINATKIDNTGRNPGDPEEIISNLSKYSVMKTAADTITVTDNGLVPYIGGNQTTEKKWVGLIVDFGVTVQGAGENAYHIEDIDRTDARSWGATSDTAFVLWTITDNNRTITFADESDPTRTFDLKINFVEGGQD